ncbi:MAG: hypothetical protein HOU81_25360 [Hamadaea sp.]|uniref:hypothetical protein n=1 Tax=Hamadaea sp. TaxID=2024425 RepID=UPI0018232733|nr:hypothetical protein [Hamadaea sp.]NUR74151.1 hypothetical protein [Hamadaea sp.]NUT19422.1 hypothetical protein [Hamadaea sp.]
MPASSESPERQNGKLPTGLLWAGVGVAPLAALALLVGSGDRSLRAAIGLALLSVVLIGLAIVLRPAPDSLKVELEDTIYDEIDVVREDARNDITTAARATHRAFSERFQQLQEAVDQMRTQVEALRGELARGNAQPPSPHPTSPRPGTVSGSVPAGVVRHTETVQVTTRSTIVDPHVDEPAHTGRATPPPSQGWSDNAPVAGRSGGRRRAEDEDRWPGYAQPAYPAQPARPAYGDEYQESWTEQQLRKRLAEQTQQAAPPREPLLSHEDNPRDRWSRRSEPTPVEPDWQGVRAGDRWAAVRNDDRGAELRMGERRASMHSDENGSELRIEDRWAAVRRDDPVRRDEPRAGRHDSVSWDGDRWTDQQRSPRALPAQNDEPSVSEWLNQWPPREQEPRRRRYADDY